MCRQYVFRFLECCEASEIKHDVNDESWQFPCGVQDGECVLKRIVVEDHHHCFACTAKNDSLYKIKEPGTIRSPLTQQQMIELEMGLMILDHIWLHHKTHSSGVHAFEYSDLQVLSSYQKKLI